MENAIRKSQDKMKFKIGTFNHYFEESLNILWKLGLGAVGVAAICFTIFIVKEIQQEKMRGGKKLSRYVMEYDKDGYVSLYNQREKKHTLERLDWISHLDNSEDSIAVYCKNCRRGFYDYGTGKPLTENIYDKAWNFHEGLGAVEKDGTVYFLNTEMQQAFQHKYKVVRASDDYADAIRFEKGQCLMALTSDSMGVIGKDGEWVIEPEYEYISGLAMDSCRVVKKDGLAGIVDYNGKVLMEPTYDAIHIPNPGLAVVAKDGYQKQIVVETGTVLRDFVFDDFAEFKENPTDEYQKYEVNQKWGVVRTQDFRIVIPAIYADVEYLNGNRFKAQLPNENDVVTSNTNTISYVILDANNNILMDGR